MLQAVLNSAEFKENKKAIEETAEITRSLLTEKTFKIDLTMFSKLKEKFIEKYKSQVTSALFRSKGLPSVLGNALSSFIEMKDTGKMAAVNRATGDAAREESPFKKPAKKR